jgi:hypothetical protein
MAWSDLKTYYKSILVLFILCNAINIPLIVYRKQISNYFASYKNLTTEDKKRALFNWLNYISLFISVFINFPLMSKLKSNTLLWIYIVVFVFFAIINPIGIFTDVAWVRFAVICSLPLIFGLLKSLNQTSNDFNAWLFTGLVCVLTLFNNSMIHTFYTTLTTYPEFYIYSIFYLVGYIFVMRTRSINVAAIVNYIQTRSFPKINKLFIAEMFILFLFVYIRTMTKNYYGGKLIVADPISLQRSTGYVLSNKLYEYTISSWFNLNAHGSNYNAASAEFTSILMYGNYIMVSYKASTNTMQINIKNKDETHTYNMHPKLQTWNHLVLMYSNGVFDMFINGELKDTFNIVPDSTNQQLTIGSTKGVLGRMCSITYYNSKIDEKLITSIYQALKDKDPPMF